MRHTLANLRRNKLRSFLTLFGIAWGIVSLVLMSALTSGFKQGQRKNMKQIGENIVFVAGGKTEKQAGGQRAGRRIRLRESDVRAIREQCPSVSVVSAEQKTFQAPVRSQFNAGRFLTLGVTPDYLSMRTLPVEKGRQISDDDVREGRRLAVLGPDVRKQLFEKRPEVIGQTIYINNYPYQVIGLMPEKKQNSTYDGWDNEKVLVPLTALKRDVPASRDIYAYGYVGMLLYQPVSVRVWETAQHEVKSVLGRIHGFDPTDESALMIWDTIKNAELFDAVFSSMEIFLGFISIVTLSLGGVGVMNTMMMAVAERTPEVGLKKALGATRRRILADFFLEGLCLAFLAGTAGLLLVSGLAGVVNLFPMPVMFSGLPIEWRQLLVATAALGTVAVLAALPPAWRASRLTPVEALRQER